MPSVLFVCTGNQFRSPIAAARFRQLLTNTDGSKEWVVDSAGIWTVEGGPSPVVATTAAAAMGISLDSHRTRMISKPLLTESDLIVVMTRGQQEAIGVEFPEARGRICLLSELAGGLPGDVPDPPAAPGEIPKILRDVCDLVDEAFPAIRKLAELHMENRS